MAVEFPPPKRRASGLRRVRDQRDLRPFVNPTPLGRRMDASGSYLSVRVPVFPTLDSLLLPDIVAMIARQATDNKYRGDVPHMQSTVPI